MKEGNDQDEAGRLAAAFFTLASSGRLNRRTRGKRHDGLTDRTVRRDGPLGEASGSRRVKNRSVHVRCHLDEGHRGSANNHLMPVLNPRGQRQKLIKANTQDSHTRALTDFVRSSYALGVGDQDTQPGVVHRVVQFLLGPPRVERHRNRANGGDGGERDNPLGQVAHGNSHAIALFNVVVMHQRVTQRVHFSHDFAECPLFVLVDQKGLLETARAVEELAQVRG